MQHAVTWAMRDLEEYLPSNVVFCVGIFNALYMSKCMQSNASRFTCCMILLLNAIQSAQTYRRLRKSMARIYELALECDCHYLVKQNLLSAQVKLSQEPGVLQPSDNSTNVRLRSPIKPQYSHQSTVILDQLAKEQLASTKKNRLTASLSIGTSSKNDNTKMASDAQMLSVARIYPAPESPNQTKLAQAVKTTPSVIKNKILLEALMTLFECEYFALMAFVRGAVPSIYATYVMIMGYLPSAEYYPEHAERRSCKYK